MSQALGQVYATEYNGSRLGKESYARCTEKREVNMKIQQKPDTLIDAITKLQVDNTVMIKNHNTVALPILPFQNATAGFSGADVFNSDVGALATNKTYNTKHNGKLNGTMPSRLYLLLGAGYDPTTTPAGGRVGELFIKLLDKDGNALVGAANDGFLVGNYIQDRTQPLAAAGKLIARWVPATKTHYLLPSPLPNNAAGTSFEIILDYHSDWIQAPIVSF